MTVRAEKAIVAAVLLATMPVAFFWVADVTRAQAASGAWLETELDRWLPLCPSAVWLYASWYPAHAVLPFLGAADFRRGTRAYAIGFAVCLLCYVALPASIHRPAVPDAGPSAAALAILYRHDPPVNVFPSFHATVAAVLYGLRGRGPWCSLGTGVWALAVCIACVLTKQHYVIDVVAGFLLGAIALRLASHVTKVDAGALRIGFAPPGPGRTPTVLPLRPTAP